MAPAGLLFVLLVVSLMSALGVLGILAPAPLARVIAAGIRTLPVVAPKSMQERIASGSSPLIVRAWGILAVAFCAVIVTDLVAKIIDGRIWDQEASASVPTPWPLYVMATVHLLFGLILVLRSGPIHDRVRTRFAGSGADLRRWMLVALGAVASR